MYVCGPCVCPVSSEARTGCPVLSTAELSLQPTLLLETKSNCPGAHQLGRLPGQQALKIHLSLLSQPWNYNFFSYEFGGLKLGLQAPSKHFTNYSSTSSIFCICYNDILIHKFLKACIFFTYQWGETQYTMDSRRQYQKFVVLKKW